MRMHSPSHRQQFEEAAFVGFATDSESDWAANVAISAPAEMRRKYLVDRNLQRRNAMLAA